VQWLLCSSSAKYLDILFPTQSRRQPGVDDLRASWVNAERAGLISVRSRPSSKDSVRAEWTDLTIQGLKVAEALQIVKPNRQHQIQYGICMSRGLLRTVKSIGYVLRLPPATHY
jgi:hypothetical protein